MKRLKRHIKRWYLWQKGCLNSPVYKILVLLKISHSPTFNHFLLPEEWDEIKNETINFFGKYKGESKSDKV